MRLKACLLLLCGALSAVAATDWKAQWIWMPEAETSDMMLTRKIFDLSEVPDNASLSITASSRYELFVNGQAVARGPARCAPHHQSFDVHPVSRFLQAGKNVIAIRVHHQPETVSYYEASRGGLLAQIDGLDVQTDSSWRVVPDKNWNSASQPMARFHLEVCDEVDLRNRSNHWNTAGFDDSGWADARVLKREVGWPSPQSNDRPTHLVPPWTTLVERDIPYLKESIVEAEAPIYIGSIPGGGAGGTPAIPCRTAGVSPAPVPQAARLLPANAPNECRVLIHDLGEVHTGRPYLDIEAPAGTEVEIMAAPYLLNEKILPRIVASTYTDRIVCSGRRERWEAFYMKPTRYLAIVFRTLEGEANVYGAGVVRSDYPFEEKGFFQCEEKPELEALWKASAKTIRVCTSDAYTDNYRERRQYAQTAWYAGLGNYAVFGDTALQRRYLIQIAQEQLPDGIMPAYAPRHGSDFMVILDSNCFWIRGLHQYLLHSGDEQTVRELLPAARRLMELLSSYSNASQLIDSPPFPYWLDHAVQDRRGANFCLNAHYLGAVEDFSRVLDWLGESDADLYAERAVTMRAGLKKFWDAANQLFADALVDGERSSLFSEHANAMALAMQIATPEQAAVISARLFEAGKSDLVKHADGTIVVTPAMSFFLHAGLCEAGYAVKSLDLLHERFSHMLEPGTNGTLWEEWWLDGTGRSGSYKPFPVGRSDAQTESAFPPALFVRYLLGVEPIAPGMRTVLIHPVPAGLDCEGTIPTPSGLLHVKWHGSEVTVSAPAGIDIQLAPGCTAEMILN